MSIRKNIEKLIESGVTAYKVSKETGLSRNPIERLFRGDSTIDNLTLKSAEILNLYYLKEMEKMEKTQWEFEEYTVYLESDVLRFENNDGDVLGYVSNVYENDLIDDLNNGVDPIADLWEDGVGNTINIDGWGNDEA